MIAKAKLAAARKAADYVTEQDIALIMRTRFERSSQQIDALKRVTATKNAINALLRRVDTVTQTDPVTRKVEQEVNKVIFESVAVVLKTTASLDVRAAQVHELSKHQPERDAQFQHIAKLPPEEKKEEAGKLVEDAGKAFRAIRKIVADPYNYIFMAEQFWSGEVRAMVSTTHWRSLNKLKLSGNAEMFKAMMAKVEAKLDKVLYLKANKVALTAEKLGKFIGYVGIGLIVMNVVIRTISDAANWSTTLAKSGLIAAGTLAVSYIVTSGAVASAISWGGFLAGVITNTAWIASVTAEVPPVACVIIAVGVCVLIGAGIAALVNHLIDTWFGGPIPASMRARMTTPMSSRMSSSMSSPMFSAMS